MALFPIHIGQAEYNKDLAEHLFTNEYRDWAITVCYYAAIHYYEARIYIQNRRTRRHTETDPDRGIVASMTTALARWTYCLAKNLGEY